jgi:hypothetical protein
MGGDRGGLAQVIGKRGVLAVVDVVDRSAAVRRNVGVATLRDEDVCAVANRRRDRALDRVEGSPILGIQPTIATASTRIPSS